MFYKVSQLLYLLLLYNNNNNNNNTRNNLYGSVLPAHIPGNNVDETLS
jgi:hypothetical protein